MAGKPRRRIDYAGWSVDIFSNDTKIDKLLDAQGWIGFGIYFYLCQMAFGSEGYFYEWCYDLCATTARKMGGGVGAGTVKETVDYCLQIGLFDKGLFDRWGVLTSRGIQKSYLVVLKSKKRTGTEIIKDYWLLENEKDGDFQGVIFVPKNKEKFGENRHSLGGNGHSLGGNGDLHGQKYSRVKSSKVNNNKLCKAEALALFETLWKMYPNKKGKAQVTDKDKQKLLEIGLEEMTRAINRYKAELEKDKEWRKPQNGSTYFHSGYVDYLDSNYEECKQPVKKSSFNNFQQNDYDFDELEKELLSN